MKSYHAKSSISKQPDRRAYLSITSEIAACLAESGIKKDCLARPCANNLATEDGISRRMEVGRLTNLKIGQNYNLFSGDGGRQRFVIEKGHKCFTRGFEVAATLASTASAPFFHLDNFPAFRRSGDGLH